VPLTDIALRKATKGHGLTEFLNQAE